MLKGGIAVQEDRLLLYKLIVLYMLGKVNFPMTNDQLSRFILTQGYTDYFKFQETMSDLLETGMISGESVRNNTYYSISDKGRETIQYFQYKISDAIRQDIHDYLRSNEYDLREEVSLVSDYTLSKNRQYAVKLKIREQDSYLLDMTLLVPQEEQARAMCDQWQEKSQKIYAYIMKQLMAAEKDRKEQKA